MLASKVNSVVKDCRHALAKLVSVSQPLRDQLGGYCNFSDSDLRILLQGQGRRAEKSAAAEGAGSNCIYLTALIFLIELVCERSHYLQDASSSMAVLGARK